MKTSYYYLMLVWIVTYGTSGFSQGVPAKNPNCEKKMHLRHVEGSSGVYFNEDCSIAFVLPANTGKLRIDEIAPNANLSNCEAMEGMLTNVNSMIRQSSALVEKLSQLKSPSSENSQKETNNSEVNGPNYNPPSYGGPGFGGPGYSGPKLIEINSYANGAETTAPQNSLAKPLQSELIESYSKELNQIRLQILEEKKLADSFAGYEAATAHFLLQMETGELVKRYQQANPGMVFKPLIINQSFLSINSKDDDHINSGRAGVLSITVPGFGMVPNSMSIKNDSVSDSRPLNAVAMGSSLAGEMRLSLFGACPFYDKRTRQLPTQIGGSKLSAHLSANLIFEYELQTFRSYRAKYNLGSLVRKILSRSSQGGFFETRTLTSFINDEKSVDWFIYESQSEDSRLNSKFDSAQIKASLIDRVMKEITANSVGGPVPDTGSLANKPNGASTAASELSKCPNFYCQAGAVILRVLNDSAGSESAVNSYLKQHDYWATENVTEKEMVKYIGSSAFTGN